MTKKDAIIALNRAVCFDYAWTLKNYFGTSIYNEIKDLLKNLEDKQ